jgi:LTXXQ motif family protein
MRTHRPLLLTAALLFAAAPALAQQSSAPLPGNPPAMGDTMRNGGMMEMEGGGMMMGRGGGMMPMMMMPMMGIGRHVEGWLAFIKTELKIAEPQEKLWSAFADAVRANAKAMQEGGMPMMGRMRGRQGGETLPEGLAARERMLEVALANVKRLKAAADPLYAALNAEQKRTADELVGRMGMPMRPMGMRLRQMGMMMR